MNTIYINRLGEADDTDGMHTIKDRKWYFRLIQVGITLKKPSFWRFVIFPFFHYNIGNKSIEIERNFVELFCTCLEYLGNDMEFMVEIVRFSILLIEQCAHFMQERILNEFNQFANKLRDMLKSFQHGVNTNQILLHLSNLLSARLLMYNKESETALQILNDYLSMSCANKTINDTETSKAICTSSALTGNASNLTAATRNICWQLILNTHSAVHTVRIVNVIMNSYRTFVNELHPHIEMLIERCCKIITDKSVLCDSRQTLIEFFETIAIYSSEKKIPEKSLSLLVSTFIKTLCEKGNPNGLKFSDKFLSVMERFLNPYILKSKLYSISDVDNYLSNLRKSSQKYDQSIRLFASMMNLILSKMCSDLRPTFLATEHFVKLIKNIVETQPLVHDTAMMNFVRQVQVFESTDGLIRTLIEKTLEANLPKIQSMNVTNLQHWLNLLDTLFYRDADNDLLENLLTITATKTMDLARCLTQEDSIAGNEILLRLVDSTFTHIDQISDLNIRRDYLHIVILPLIERSNNEAFHINVLNAFGDLTSESYLCLYSDTYSVHTSIRAKCIVCSRYFKRVTKGNLPCDIVSRFYQIIGDSVKFMGIQSESELCQRMTEPFHYGLQSHHENVYHYMFKVIDEVYPTNLANRLLIIFGEEGWETLCVGYFLGVATRFLLQCSQSDGSLTNSQNELSISLQTERFSQNMNIDYEQIDDGSDLLTALGKLLHFRDDLAHDIFPSMCHQIINSFTNNEREEILDYMRQTLMSPEIIHQIGTPLSVAYTIAKSLQLCAPYNNAMMMQYIGGHHRFQYSHMMQVENYINKFGWRFHSTENKPMPYEHHALMTLQIRKLLCDLEEHDYFSSMIIQNCREQLTKDIFTMDRCNTKTSMLVKIDQAKKALDKLIADNPDNYDLQDGASFERDSIMMRFKECLQYLNEWDVLLEGDHSASRLQVAECSWRNGKWNLLRDSLINIEEEFEGKDAELNISIMKAISSCIDGIEFSTISKLNGDATNALLYKWSLCPLIIGDAHLKILDTCQRVTELVESMEVIKSIKRMTARIANTGQAFEDEFSDLVSLINAWKIRTFAVSDSCSNVNDIVAWRDISMHYIASIIPSDGHHNLEDMCFDMSNISNIELFKSIRKSNEILFALRHLLRFGNEPPSQPSTIIASSKQIMKCGRDAASFDYSLYSNCWVSSCQDVIAHNENWYSHRINLLAFNKSSLDIVRELALKGLQIAPQSPTIWMSWSKYLLNELLKAEVSESTPSSKSCLLTKLNCLSEASAYQILTPLINALKYTQSTEKTKQICRRITSLIGCQPGNYFKFSESFLQLHNEVPLDKWVHSVPKLISVLSTRNQDQALFDVTRNLCHHFPMLSFQHLYPLTRQATSNNKLRNLQHEIVESNTKCIISKAFFDCLSEMPELKLNNVVDKCERITFKLIEFIKKNHKGVDISKFLVPFEIKQLMVEINELCNNIHNSGTEDEKSIADMIISDGGIPSFDDITAKAFITRLQRWIHRIRQTLQYKIENQNSIQRWNSRLLKICMIGDVNIPNQFQRYVKELHASFVSPVIKMVWKYEKVFYQITIRAVTGKKYIYLLGHPNHNFDTSLLATEAIQSIMLDFNYRLQRFQGSRSRWLNLHVPLCQSLGNRIIFQDFNDSVCLMEILRKSFENDDKNNSLSDLLCKYCKFASADFDNETKKKVYARLIPDNIVQEWATNLFPSSETYFVFRKMLARKDAVLSLLQIIFNWKPFDATSTVITPSLCSIHNVNYNAFRLNMTSDFNVPFRLGQSMERFYGEWTLLGPYQFSFVAAAKAFIRPTSEELQWMLRENFLILKFQENHERYITAKEALVAGVVYRLEGFSKIDGASHPISKQIKKAIENRFRMGFRWMAWL
ncbi:hypothetical protein GJ496_011869 [Pomphorhynchus laevis]|nr:hypothetical protein GJ496_011869 [Pomphorhynchus laevis]